MRRFPPPPGTAGPSTPFASKLSSSTAKPASERSTEAPMQFEWAAPRTFPSSPFMSAGTPHDDTGERARKRTHYEAMDVDTPPRHVLGELPPSATEPSSNQFHFNSSDTLTSTSDNSALPGPNSSPHLDFDAASFEPAKAFGMEEDHVSTDDKVGDDGKALTVVSGLKKQEGSTEARRRRGGATTGASARRKVSPAFADEEVEEDDEIHSDGGRGKSGGGFMGMLSNAGRAGSSSEFSFQVHHHHAASASGAEGSYHTPPGWFHNQTPYTLLGYLQFASLTLLALIFLSISLLFLYTLYTDVQDRLTSLTAEIRAEIMQCAKAYVDNRCQPETRLPAMERQCSGWEECMGREAVVVGKTRVVAEILAEVVNGFVDVISFKTMFFVIATLGIMIYGSSAAMSLLPSRSSTPPHATLHPANPAYHPHAPPSQFQHLGYQPYGYPPLAPSPGYGSPWATQAASHREQEQASLGLGAPPIQEKGGKKGWLK
ncbi:hypothetical protein T439DRAFT_195282 [Meredithblackwellia eburnea MCA 4105]